MSFAVAKYRSARTTTASPLQVLIQLYDGAIRFLRQGQEAMKSKDYATKGKMISKAHAIVSELQATLRPEHSPELCDQLFGLYDFALHRITQANIHNDPDELESVIKVLTELRAGWAELNEQQGGKPAEAPVSR